MTQYLKLQEKDIQEILGKYNLKPIDYKSIEEACQYYKAFDLGMAVVGLCTERSKTILPKVRSLVRGYHM